MREFQTRCVVLKRREANRRKLLSGAFREPELGLSRDISSSGDAWAVSVWVGVAWVGVGKGRCVRIWLVVV